jgi:hypothetical protein
MLGSELRWRLAVCVVSVPVIVLAGGCSSSGPSSSPAGQATTSHQAAPGGAGSDQPSAPNASASAAASPVKLTSGVMAQIQAGNKWIYGFIDPNSGQYSEAVVFTVPPNATAQGVPFRALAASPDLTKFAVTSMVNGRTMAGWIDSGGQFTAVTTAAAGDAFGGVPPSYTAIGFDRDGNFYYKKNSQGARYTEVYEVSAGSTGNPQQVTMTPPGAVDRGAALNSDGSLVFGCENMMGNWLNANTMVMAVAPGNQIAKVAVAGRGKGGCPVTAANNEVTLLPATNSAQVHNPVANSDGTKVAFFYDDPDRVKHNFPTIYIVGADGQSQPTVINLSESDAKKLTGATLLKWS